MHSFHANSLTYTKLQSNLLPNRQMQSLLIGHDHGENRLKDKSDERVQTEEKTERILVEMRCEVESETTVAE